MATRCIFLLSLLYCIVYSTVTDYDFSVNSYADEWSSFDGFQYNVIGDLNSRAELKGWVLSENPTLGKTWVLNCSVN